MITASEEVGLPPKRGQAFGTSSLDTAGILIVMVFNTILLLSWVIYIARTKQWSSEPIMPIAGVEEAPDLPAGGPAIGGATSNGQSPSSNGEYSAGHPGINGSDAPSGRLGRYASGGPLFGEGRQPEQSSENSLIMMRYGFKQGQMKPTSIGGNNKIILSNTSNIYEALIDNDETDSQQQRGFGQMEASMMNESRQIIPSRQFGVNSNGQVNLGLATPLFFPADVSVIQAQQSFAQQSSIIKGVGMSQNSGMVLGITQNSQIMMATMGENQLNMTRQLLQALTPSKKLKADGDNYELMALRELEGAEGDHEQQISLEYPSGFAHLLRILRNSNDKNQLAMSNPDGYFYLLFLKTCLKIFSVSSLCYAALAVLYAHYNLPEGEDDKKKARSGLFQLASLPPCLDNPSAYHIVLGIAFLSAFIAMYYLVDFCNEMSMFEFCPDLQILDQFIQLHTLMVRGVNTGITSDQARRGIQKVFSQRFGASNILKIQVFRDLGDLKDLIKKRKKLKKKLTRAKKWNHRNTERMILSIGGILSKKTVDAEDHYRKEIHEIDRKMQDIQQESKKTNLGIAFISFKQRDHVTDTLEEIELVKQNLMNDKKTQKLGIANWRVEQAFPPSDILWNDLSNFGKDHGFLWNWSLYLISVLLSFLFTTAIVFLDHYALKKHPGAALVLQYFTPIAMACFTLYLSPNLCFWLTEQENHERKSVKESSFLAKVGSAMMKNLILYPFLANLTLSYFLKPKHRDGKDAPLLEMALEDMSGFYLRYFMQIILLAVLSQIFFDFSKLVQNFEKAIRDNGKTKFTQWFRDLSFKSCTVVSVFTFGMCLCLFYPLMTPFILGLFYFQLFADRYNLLYVYPLEFESSSIARKILVKQSFYGVIMFQLTVLLVGTFQDDLLSWRAKVYLFSFVFIQFIMIVTVFEFMRTPWEGVEIELEKALDLQQNKVLEDSISCMTMAEVKSLVDHAASADAENQTKVQDEIIHAQVMLQRINVLKEAFSNPTEAFLDYEPWKATEDEEQKEQAATARKESFVALPPLYPEDGCTIAQDASALNLKKATPPSSGHGASTKKIRKKSNSNKSDFASSSSLAGSSKLGEQERGDSGGGLASSIISPTNPEGKPSGVQNQAEDPHIGGGSYGGDGIGSQDYNEEQHEQDIQQKHEEYMNQLNLTLIHEEIAPRQDGGLNQNRGDSGDKANSREKPSEEKMSKGDSGEILKEINGEP